MTLMTTWRHDSLREFLRKRDREDFLSIEIVNSLGRNRSIFLLHSCEARDALNGHFNLTDAQSPENFRKMLGIDEDQDAYEEAKVVSEAHLIGCLHAARAQADILGFLINRVLLAPELPERSCSIYSVTEKVRDDYVKAKFRDLLASPEFNYLSAFINTTKHRRLVRHGASMSFEDNKIGIQVGAFDYDGRSYSPKWAHDVLREAHIVMNHVVDVGCAVNAALGVRD